MVRESITCIDEDEHLLLYYTDKGLVLSVNVKAKYGGRDIEMIKKISESLTEILKSLED